MTYDAGNPGHGMGQTQTCGSVNFWEDFHFVSVSIWGVYHSIDHAPALESSML